MQHLCNIVANMPHLGTFVAIMPHLGTFVAKMPHFRTFALIVSIMFIKNWEHWAGYPLDGTDSV